MIFRDIWGNQIKGQKLSILVKHNINIHKWSHGHCIEIHPTAYFWSSWARKSFIQGKAMNRYSKNGRHFWQYLLCYKNESQKNKKKIKMREHVGKRCRSNYGLYFMMACHWYIKDVSIVTIPNILWDIQLQM